MIDREDPGRVNVITHIHTNASNSDASEMEMITHAIREIAGENTAMQWGECFTPIEKLLRLVRVGRTRRGPVHMVIVTDHMRRKSHRYPAGHLAAAASDHRLVLGAEIRTRARDVDGVYRKAPEIIAYGGVHPVNGPFGPYYGLSTELLEELYDTCMDDEGKELCTRKARALLLRRGIVHGLSHPFDGHELSLEGTFRLISEFTFIEVINGGYFADSSRVLDAYVRLHNAVVSGACLPDEILTDTGRRLVEHMRAQRRLLCPLSGSDAHIIDLDRVVLSFALPPGKTRATVRPSDLFAVMLAAEEGDFGSMMWARLAGNHPLVAQPRFANLGRPATRFAQVSDIVLLIGLNFLANYRHLTPTVLAKGVVKAYNVTSEELRKRWGRQDGLHRRLREEFDPERLLQFLVFPGAPKARIPTHFAKEAPGPC